MQFYRFCLKNVRMCGKPGVDCRVPHGFMIFPFSNPKKVSFT